MVKPDDGLIYEFYQICSLQSFLKFDKLFLWHIGLLKERMILMKGDSGINSLFSLQ
jgi:hypothetical protein